MWSGVVWSGVEFVFIGDGWASRLKHVCVITSNKNSGESWGRAASSCVTAQIFRSVNNAVPRLRLDY